MHPIPIDCTLDDAGKYLSDLWFKKYYELKTFQRKEVARKFIHDSNLYIGFIICGRRSLPSGLRRSSAVRFIEELFDEFDSWAETRSRRPSRKQMVACAAFHLHLVISHDLKALLVKETAGKNVVLDAA